MDVMIIPIHRNEAQRELVRAAAQKLMAQLADLGIVSRFDDRNMRVRDKFAEWERSGPSVRVELGPKDVSMGRVYFKTDMQGPKHSLSWEAFLSAMADLAWAGTS